jgi:hypothetical protein
MQCFSALLPKFVFPAKTSAGTVGTRQQEKERRRPFLFCEIKAWKSAGTTDLR